MRVDSEPPDPFDVKIGVQKELDAMEASESGTGPAVPHDTPEPAVPREVHVGIAAFACPPGAHTETYVRNLATALAQLGHRVDVISGPPYPALDPKIRLICLPSMGAHGPRPSLRQRMTTTSATEWAVNLTGGHGAPAAFGKRLRGYLVSSGESYDVIHDIDCLAPALADLHVPVVSTIQDPIQLARDRALLESRGTFERLRIKRRFSYLKKHARTAQGVAHVITGTEQTRRDLASILDIPSERISVIHRGVDPAFRPVREAVVDNRLVTRFDGFDPEAMRTVLTAFAALKARLPNVMLSIVGGSRELRGAVALARELDLRDRIHTVENPSAQQLRSLLASSRLMVVGSSYDGVGASAAEAMACRCPVVSPEGGAVPEVIGNAGILVPPSAPEALARAIRRVMTDDKLRDELADRGLRRMADLNWHNAAESVADVYRGAVRDARFKAAKSTLRSQPRPTKTRTKSSGNTMAT